VDNSLKHGEKVTRIRLSFQEDGESGVLIYEDDGVGIQNDQKELIFEQGFGRHLGLGLFLSRGILAVTGITIRETGVQGEGSRFEMRIPKGLFRVKRPGD
jgi:signal transduction histidine kinase